MSEEVLCIRRWWFEKLVKHYFKGEEFHPYDFEMLTHWKLNEKKIAFVPRSKCENDPKWLQIIPYLMVSSRQPMNAGKNVLVYRRSKSGSEGRLHGKYSVGIGGHINPGDTTNVPGYDNVFTYITACANRELNEELHVGDYEMHGLGWIFEDTTEVGTVHIGAAILVTLDKPEATAKDDEISDLRFSPLESLCDPENSSSRDGFEIWSKVLLGSSACQNGRVCRNFPLGRMDKTGASV